MTRQEAEWNTERRKKQTNRTFNRIHISKRRTRVRVTVEKTQNFSHRWKARFHIFVISCKYWNLGTLKEIFSHTHKAREGEREKKSQAGLRLLNLSGTFAGEYFKHKNRILKHRSGKKMNKIYRSQKYLGQKSRLNFRAEKDSCLVSTLRRRHSNNKNMCLSYETARKKSVKCFKEHLSKECT